LELERNLLRHGCLEALVVWHEQQVLLDGHTRYAICLAHQLPYAVRLLSLPTPEAAQAWMLAHQLGRRNLTPEQASYLRGKQYLLEKQPRGGTRSPKGHSDPVLEGAGTAGRLSAQHHVSAKTIKRDAAYARAVDRLAEALGPETRQTLLAPDTKLPRRVVTVVSAIAHTSPPQAEQVLHAVTAASTPREVRRILTHAQREDPAQPARSASLAAAWPQVHLWCRDIAAISRSDVPDESVDALVTDPPYGHEAVPLFDTLGALAKRVLKPGGSLVVLCGQAHLPEYLDLLRQHLTYHWMLTCHLPGGQAVQAWAAQVQVFTKQVLWFIKPPGRRQQWVSDWIVAPIVTPANSQDKRYHKWGQSESLMREILERFTSPGEVIYDPFLGGGTTGVVCQALRRKFVGSDIDPLLVEQARRRLEGALGAP
jgi:hypothetical protein